MDIDADGKKDRQEDKEVQRQRCRQIEVEIGKRRTDGEIDRRGRRDTDRQKAREMQKEKAKMETLRREVVK